MRINGQGMGVEQLGKAVDGVLSITMSRRRALRLLGTAGATAIVAGVVKAGPAGAAGVYYTTSALNLRAKPNSTAKVLLVMPKGATVEDIGGGGNGYAKVRYNGTRGYASAQYLSRSNGNHDPVITGASRVNTDVNLRSGPSSSNQVLRVIAVGTDVSVSNQVKDGYRYVIHLGLGGWVWDAYLGGDGGGVAHTTTSAVNLRTNPNTSARVITVVPRGKTVYELGDFANGFARVTYNGTTGWVYSAYLA